MQIRKVQEQKFENLPRRLPHVTEDNIEQLYTQSMRDTRRLLKNNPDLSLVEVHKSIFKNIYYCAGKEEYKEAPFAGGVLNCKKEFADVEKEIIDKQINTLKTNDFKKQVVAITFEHLRNYGMHPFQDGNTRTNTLKLEARLNRLLKNTTIKLDQFSVTDEYYWARNQAYKHETPNLAPMANYILKSLGIEPLKQKFIASPYTVRCARSEIKFTKPYKNAQPLYDWHGMSLGSGKNYTKTSWFNNIEPNSYIDALEIKLDYKFITSTIKENVKTKIQSLRYKPQTVVEAVKELKNIVSKFSSPQKKFLESKNKYQSRIIKDKNQKLNILIPMVFQSIMEVEPEKTKKVFKQNQFGNKNKTPEINL